MEELKHFSHEHLLILVKGCAELPEDISHAMHPQHRLILHDKPPYSGGSCFCNGRQQMWSITMIILAMDFPVISATETLWQIIGITTVAPADTFHEQHLLKILEKAERDETVQKSICYGCGAPVLSEPTYSCKECSIFLHRRCVELPKDISHAMHPQHRLTLLEKPPNKEGICDCKGCGQSWRHFTYHCNTCNFNLDVSCATEDRKLKHPAHAHTLKFVPKPVIFECHACWERKKDASYLCTSSRCPYWIHERCASSPTVKKRKDHDHPLSLAYYLSDDYIAYEFSCDVCDKMIEPNDWNYYCGPCRHFVHLTCIETRDQRRRTVLDVMPAIWIPMVTRSIARDVASAQMSSVETYQKRFIMDLTAGTGSSVPENIQSRTKKALLPKRVKHRWDKHPLVLSFPPFFKQADKFYCGVCEEEIHPRHWQYRCSECDQSFHPRCIPQASSSRNIKFGITTDVGAHPHTLKLVLEGEYRSACFSCKASLYGRRAFKCTATCKFYLCHDCVAERSADTSTH
ncbi:uncharacterized protein [Coffea arabica]|uniref:Phorbol-ester/DAG-type domain-containing protein n=1 Tax=Coffea arabica TaxID=13443 RepID=A0A6P6T066_COFAR|nr:uncharacterized protein LOC113696497 [Coffea arabica]